MIAYALTEQGSQIVADIDAAIPFTPTVKATRWHRRARIAEAYTTRDRRALLFPPVPLIFACRWPSKDHRYGRKKWWSRAPFFSCRNGSMVTP